MEVKHCISTKQMKRQAKVAFFIFIIILIGAKLGINYPYLEPVDEFWNEVRVPRSCYKSLVAQPVTVDCICLYLTDFCLYLTVFERRFLIRGRRH